MANRLFHMLILPIVLSACGTNEMDERNPEKTNADMDQRLSIITLGAENLKSLRGFYVDKFGWETVAENDNIVFFKLNGLLLGLYGKEELAEFDHDTPQSNGFKSFTLAYMVDSKEEVIRIYETLKAKGVHMITEPAEPPIGGYYFMMADIEGNVWEVAWNLYMPLDKQGNVITHKPIK